MSALVDHPSPARAAVPSQRVPTDLPDNVVLMRPRVRPAFSPSPQALLLSAIVASMPLNRRGAIRAALKRAEAKGDPNAEAALMIALGDFGSEVV